MCSCNLKLRIKPEQQRIPVVFHNLKGYDGHHIINSLGKTTTDVTTYTDGNGRERVSHFVDVFGTAYMPFAKFECLW